ncbi:hypothetical protein HYV58_01425, partial [Candidatus Peregrinibacteria bacterium]|nr:hypothetical protein [Candidatus Peregrinibacteria bacterium]
ILKKFGIAVRRRGYRAFFVKAPQRYRPIAFDVEGDASSASYFWAIEAISGTPVDIRNAPRFNKTSQQPDMAMRSILKKSALPDIIDCRDFPDSAMTLAVYLAFRKGKFRLTGLQNLRMKECDRLRALVTELNKIGCRTHEEDDGMTIYGAPDSLHGAHIKTYNDHRMAMCFGVAGFFIQGITIENPSCVSKTYPKFWRDLAALKKDFSEKNIILTGMRGCGKSALGAALAKAEGRRFIDIDAVVERRARKSIGEIVAARGWRYFRALESEAVDRISRVRHAVIATGGGTLMRKKNAEALKKTGKIIWLDCPVSILKKRLAGNQTRPALTPKGHFLRELSAVYRKRKKRYHYCADAVLDVSLQTSDAATDFMKKKETLGKIIRRWGLLP